jgi:RNA polymerase sigma-70 factor, ECF subfamily
LRWVLRAQSGDADALNDLLESIQEPLFGYIRSLVRDPHGAQDILQEVLILVIRKLYWLREPKVFRPWVYRIASREAFRRLRREQRTASRSEDESLLESIAAEQVEELADSELLERVPALLEKVSPASRAVLSLHYMNGMTLREVADVLGISLGAAKARLGYGLAILREEIGLAPGSRRVGPAEPGANELENVVP